MGGRLCQPVLLLSFKESANSQIQSFLYCFYFIGSTNDFDANHYAIWSCNTPFILFSLSGFTAVFNFLVPFSVCYNSALVVGKHFFLRKANDLKKPTGSSVRAIAKPASDLYLRQVHFGGFDLYILYLVKKTLSWFVCLYNKTRGRARLSPLRRGRDCRRRRRSPEYLSSRRCPRR